MKGWAALPAVAALAACTAPADNPGIDQDGLGGAPEAGYGPFYIKDEGFPQSMGFTWRNVSWVTLTPDGSELYVLQRGAPVVSVWTPQGQLRRTWDTDALGDPHSLRFEVLSDGHWRVWITDMAGPQPAGSGWGHCVKAFDLQGGYLGSVGACGENTAGVGLDPIQFDKVTDVGFNPQGAFYAADGDIDGLNNRVMSLNQARTAAAQVWTGPGGAAGSAPGQFDLPHAMDIDVCGRIHVADALNHRIQILDTSGAVLQELACFGEDGAYGVRARADADTGEGRLYVSASPTQDAQGGTLSIYPLAACGAPQPVPAGCSPSLSWPVTLPQGSSARSLHAIDVTADGSSIYIAPLGGDLPPERWIRVWPVEEDGAVRTESDTTAAGFDGAGSTP